MYVITGATGNTGKKISETLLANGKQLRVIGRSTERLQSLIDKGAEPFVGSVKDVEFLTKAFTDATAVYAMIPPDYTAENVRAYYKQVGEVIARATS